MKLRCLIKNVLLAMLVILSFLFGFIASKMRTELDRRPRQLRGQQFVDIGEMETHNMALCDFYLKYKNGVGFAAICEKSFGGFEGPVVVYLITDDGRLTVLIEEQGVFRNSYKEIDHGSLKIGYEDSEGKFIEIDPENYKATDLQIIKAKENQHREK